MLKVCEYCGNEFEGSGNSRYCSEECKALGARAKLTSWRERTDYNERKRAQRNQAQLEHAPRPKAQNMKRLEARDRSIKLEEELQERMDQGEAMAHLINEARHNPQSWEYWHWFKQARVEYCEKHDTTCTTTVNNISVYDELFEDKVIMTIAECNSVTVRG